MNRKKTDRRVILILVGLLYLADGTAPAQADDPHQVYEGKCASCHASHAGDFVREKLELKDGLLYGTNSGQPARAFLEAGHGRLSQAEIDLLMDHFAAIQQSGRLFREKCEICHVRAVDVARGKLILHDGELIGRYTGVDTTSFLANHGRLTAEEIPVMIEVLKRQVSRRVSPLASDTK